MQRSALTHMINTRRITDTASLHEIEQLKNQFPYCATFQLLYAIGLSQADNLHQKEQINVASLYITERSKLYDYTTTKIQLHGLYPINQPIPDQKAEMVVEDIAEPADSLVEKNTIHVHEEVGNEITTSANQNKNAGEIIAEQLLSEKPLEQEIIRSAVVQLGEIAIGELLKDQLHTAENTQAKKHISIPEGGSFGDWLAALDRKSETQPNAESTAIIEKFIQESPQITPVKHSFFSPAQVGKQSLVEDESLVTETLARIYERQGDFKRASRAYANLSLKFPEKSVYFAALQKQAEEKIKN